MKKNKNFIIAFVASVFVHVQALEHISGIQGTVQKPFPYPLGAAVYNSTVRGFIVGAATNPVTPYEGQAVSIAYNGSQAFTGITPERLTVNNVADQPNPLYGKAVAYMSLLDGTPLVVTKDVPTVINVMRGYATSAPQVLQSDPLPDASGNPCSSIAGVNSFNENKAFIAAVRPQGGGAFGDPGSALVLGLLNRHEEAVGKGKRIWFSLDVGDKEPITTASAFLKIGQPLTSINNDAVQKPPVITVSEDLNLFFTGLMVTSSADPSSGARSIFVKLGNMIVPDAAITADSIIGGKGAAISLAVYSLGVLFTSTGLHYLIVGGGVIHNPDTTARSMWALPLCNNGVLAAKTAQPVSIYSEGGYLLGRALVPAATVAGDLFSPTDADIHKARIGGSVELPGDIVATYLEKDAVFVAIGSDGANERGGLFYSQAIFTPQGTIQGWTNWQRAGGLVASVTWFALDHSDANWWLVPGAPNSDHFLVERTAWGGGSGFEQTIDSYFVLQDRGIQNVVDFPLTNAAFSQQPGQRLSLFAALGFKKMVCAQSGSDQGVLFTPATQLTTPSFLTDGSTADVVIDTDHLVISGGALDELNSIYSCALVTDATDSWFVAGANGGLAVLMDSAGHGWGAGSLQKNFVGLPATLRFQVLGTFKNVRALRVDGSYLYVLTTTQLRRISCSSQVFAAASSTQPLGTLIAEAGTGVFSSIASFSDVIISGSLALLASDGGLFRTGNACDTQAATDQDEVGWTKIILPESSGPVTRLWVVSPTGDAADFFESLSGGNVYVLAGFVGQHKTQLYRLSVSPPVGPISDTTVQLFYDHFMMKVNPTFYVSRGDYRNFFATDGASFFMSRSAYYPQGPRSGLVELLPADLRTRLPLVSRSPLPLIRTTTLEDLGPIIKRSATGNWVVSGKTLRVSE